jgi:hypothetical protein
LVGKIGLERERTGLGWERVDVQRRELALSRKEWAGKEESRAWM